MLDTVYSLSGEVPPIDAAGRSGRGVSSPARWCSAASARFARSASSAPAARCSMPTCRSRRASRLELELETGEHAGRDRRLAAGQRDRPQVRSARSISCRSSPAISPASPASAAACRGSRSAARRCSNMTAAPSWPRLRDIAQGGVKIETPHPLAQDLQVTVTPEGLHPIEGVVRWTNGRTAGIAFSRELSWQELMPWLRLRSQLPDADLARRRARRRRPPRPEPPPPRQRAAQSQRAGARRAAGAGRSTSTASTRARSRSNPTRRSGSAPCSGSCCPAWKAGRRGSSPMTAIASPASSPSRSTRPCSNASSAPPAAAAEAGDARSRRASAAAGAGACRLPARAAVAAQRRAGAAGRRELARDRLAGRCGPARHGSTRPGRRRAPAVQPRAGPKRRSALPAPPPGPYRCRVWRLAEGRAPRRFPAHFCYVGVEGALLSFAKQTGDERWAGYFYVDGERRMIFLGASAAGGGALPAMAAMRRRRRRRGRAGRAAALPDRHALAARRRHARHISSSCRSRRRSIRTASLLLADPIRVKEGRDQRRRADADRRAGHDLAGAVGRCGLARSPWPPWPLPARSRRVVLVSLVVGHDPHSRTFAAIS